MKNAQMKNKVRSAVCFLLAAVMIFSLAACAGGTSDPTETSGKPDDTADTAAPADTTPPTEPPETDAPEQDEEDDMNPYCVTYYYGILGDYITPERLQEAVDAGFNLLSLDKGSIEQKKEALAWCGEHGVRATVADNRIVNLLYNEWETRLDHPEVLDEVVKMVCDDYSGYPALYGYDLIDEPGADKFPLLAALVELFHKYDPNRICYINLFPNYADPKSQLKTKDYEEHIELFLETVKPDVLSYDHYNLRWKKEKGETVNITDPEAVDAYLAKQTAAGEEQSDRLGFYLNLEDVRRYCLEYGVPYMVIVQLSEWGGYRYLTREEISYEVWQTLAYGCTMLSYFTYWTPPFDDFRNGLLTPDGEKTAHYYDVQAINAAIRPIGERIAQTRSETVFHVGDEDEREHVTRFTAEGYGAIRSIGGGDYTVGFFENGSFIIANKDYEASHRCTVTADAPLEIFDIETKTFVPVTENVFELPAGGGVYLRIADR